MDDHHITWVGVSESHFGTHRVLVVDPTIRLQQGATCWAFGLGRHLNALLKRAGLIANHSVSFLSLYDGMRDLHHVEGEMVQVEMAQDFLVFYGVPLDGSLDVQSSVLIEPRFEEGVRVEPQFGVNQMIVKRIFDFLNDDFFEQALCNLLVCCPIASGVSSLPSFSLPPQANGLYCPTVDERNRTFPTHHMMLAVGRGTRGGIPFVQYQDSTTAKDGGFRCIQLGKETIRYFVILMGARRFH